MTERERKGPGAPPRPAAGRAPEADARPEPQPRAATAPRAHAELHTIPPEWMAWSPARRAGRARVHGDATAPLSAAARPPTTGTAPPPNDAAADPAALAVADTARPPPSPEAGARSVPAPTPLLPAVTPSAPATRADTSPIVIGRDHRVVGRARRDPSDPEIAALRARETLAGDAGAVAVTPVGAPLLSDPAPPVDVSRGARPARVATAGGAPADGAGTTASERAHLALAVAIAIGSVLGALVAGLCWVGLPATPVSPPREQTRVFATRPAFEPPRATPAAAPTAATDPTTLAPREDDPAVAAGDAIAVEVVAASPPPVTTTAPRPAVPATARASAAREPLPAATTSSASRLRLVRPRGTPGAPEGKP